MYSQAVVLCALLVVATAYVSRAPLGPKPDKFKNEDGCYVPDLGKVVPFGSSAVGGTKCEKYFCNKDLISIHGCSVVAIRPGCKKVVDKSKTYPDCCPRQEC